MKKQDYWFDLPEQLIAQTPIEKREQSRLLRLDKNSGETSHNHFYQLPELLREGDCLVMNDSRVLPARLLGKRDTGGAVELVLLRDMGDGVWECLSRPGRSTRPGAKLVFGGKEQASELGITSEAFEHEKADESGVNGELRVYGETVVPEQSDKREQAAVHKQSTEAELTAEVLDVVAGGNRLVKFHYDGIFLEVLERLGRMPLPPYIKEELEDAERYQTVYSKVNGSAAAPTAGLHFTYELLEQLKNEGVELCYITLHVGLGTFRPVREENILDHELHSEYYEITPEAAAQINKTKAAGGRVIAVGTTSCRTLEAAAALAKSTNKKNACDDASAYYPISPHSASTDIFIYPGYDFKCIDGLITNFHLPESSLIMLVSALAGRENVLKAYKEAITQEYRFYSFGDAMLIL
ncbi:MAG: tRNA preQ1(34) S-adenosylmethionine ribosyltransferase-isomerase QueA [Oscillospiraceae bacterium]|nr:tRNA preQ1(34) S-adenosylmethionine ribosyltransferase-isomerase QueA [Oscillospiraceae bacterium]